MKINFKSILIIFLVAFLGAGIGTYATNEILTSTKTQKDLQNTNFSVSSVQYSDYNPSDLTNTISKAIKTVVEITCEKESSNYFYTTTGTSAGSGVIISSDGYIVTNNHVIEGGTNVKVKLNTGEEYDATIIGNDARSDIGVIKIELTDLAYSSFTDSDKLALGQTVVAIGNPLGNGLSCTDGIISALNKEITINNVIINVLQTSAAVNEGNSGGGLFDLNGNIVGIVNAKSSSASTTTVEGMGYAIPSNNAKKIVEDIIRYGYVKDRATLGVSIYTGSNAYYYSKIEGAIVSEVLENGSADKAGMMSGDIIIAIDDHEITSYTVLAQVLDKYYSVGDKCQIKIYRNDKQMTLTLTLQEATN